MAFWLFERGASINHHRWGPWPVVRGLDGMELRYGPRTMDEMDGRHTLWAESLRRSR